MHRLSRATLSSKLVWSTLHGTFTGSMTSRLRNWRSRGWEFFVQIDLNCPGRKAAVFGGVQEEERACYETPRPPFCGARMLTRCRLLVTNRGSREAGFYGMTMRPLQSETNE
jgi:hypothetical protein